MQLSIVFVKKHTEIVEIKAYVCMHLFTDKTYTTHEEQKIHLLKGKENTVEKGRFSPKMEYRKENRNPRDMLDDALLRQLLADMDDSTVGRQGRGTRGACGCGVQSRSGEGCGCGERNRSGENTASVRERREGSCGCGVQSRSGEGCGCGERNRSGENTASVRERRERSCGCGVQSRSGEGCGCNVRERGEGREGRCGCGGYEQNRTSRQENIGIDSGSCQTPCIAGPGVDPLYGFPLAMVYAPNQDWEGIFEPEEALEKGTLFSGLVFPWYPSACNDRCRRNNTGRNNGCQGCNPGTCPTNRCGNNRGDVR